MFTLPARTLNYRLRFARREWRFESLCVPVDLGLSFQTRRGQEFGNPKSWSHDNLRELQRAMILVIIENFEFFHGANRLETHLI